MTRYLPNRKEEFDLRAHVESSGHSIDTCPFVNLTEKMCKGHLVKMGGKIKSWKKRWFVFDRFKRNFCYYAGEDTFYFRNVGQFKLEYYCWIVFLLRETYTHTKNSVKGPCVGFKMWFLDGSGWWWWSHAHLSSLSFVEINVVILHNLGYKLTNQQTNGQGWKHNLLTGKSDHTNHIPQHDAVPSIGTIQKVVYFLHQTWI